MSIGTPKAPDLQFMSNIDPYAGQALGIIIFFSVIGTSYHSRAFALVQAVLPGYPQADINSALAGTSSAFFSTLGEAQRTAVVEAVIKAMRVAWATLIGGGACTLIASLFLRVSFSPLSYHSVSCLHCR